MESWKGNTLGTKQQSVKSKSITKLNLGKLSSYGHSPRRVYVLSKIPEILKLTTEQKGERNHYELQNNIHTIQHENESFWRAVFDQVSTFMRARNRWYSVWFGSKYFHQQSKWNAPHEKVGKIIKHSPPILATSLALSYQILFNREDSNRQKCEIYA